MLDNEYSIETYISKDKPETAIDALKRLKSFYLDFFSDELDEQIDSYDEDLSQIKTDRNTHVPDHEQNTRTTYKKDGMEYLDIIFEDFDIDVIHELPYFRAKETNEKVESFENNANFKLPPSFKSFLTRYGYFETGEFFPAYFSMLNIDLYENIYDKILNKHNVDMKTQVGEEGGEYLKNLYPIAVADSNHGNVFHCIDVTSVDKKTGEMNFVHWDEDDWEVTYSEFSKDKTFDRYVSDVIDKIVKSYLWE